MKYKVRKSIIMSLRKPLLCADVPVTGMSSLPAVAVNDQAQIEQQMTQIETMYIPEFLPLQLKDEPLDNGEDDIISEPAVPLITEPLKLGRSKNIVASKPLLSVKTEPVDICPIEDILTSIPVKTEPLDIEDNITSIPVLSVKTEPLDTCHIEDNLSPEQEEFLTQEQGMSVALCSKPVVQFQQVFLPDVDVWDHPLQSSCKADALTGAQEEIYMPSEHWVLQEEEPAQCVGDNKQHMPTSSREDKHDTCFLDVSKVNPKQTRSNLNVKKRKISVDPFANNSHLKQHEESPKKYVPTLFKCDRCYKIYTRLGDLRRHSDKHTNKPIYQCKHCNKTKMTIEQLSIHLDVCSEYPYTCNVCEKTFTQKCVLSKHLFTHTEERPYSCKHCKGKFKCKRHLLLHLNNSCRANHTCAECGKNFRTKEGLTAHIKDFHILKNIRCVECPARFKQESSLKKHMAQMHSNGGFECSKCSKKYVEIKDFLEHVNSCNGKSTSNIKQRSESVTKSNHCKKKAKEESNKYFECSKCYRQYIRHDRFLNHSRNCKEDFSVKEQIDPGNEVFLFKCYKCSKPFMKIDSFLSHVRNHNNDKK